MLKIEDQKKFVARRVKRGAEETQSWRLLREHMNNHLLGDNLASALVYDDFATEKQAYKAIDAALELKKDPSRSLSYDTGRPLRLQM